MVFQFTPRHFAGIETQNQWVFIGLCIIDNVLLDSGALRLPLVYIFEENKFQHKMRFLIFGKITPLAPPHSLPIISKTPPPPPAKRKIG